MKYISFPGLGIESLGIDRVAFTVFGIDIMWYGIIITAGMILAYLYGLTRAKIEKVKSDDITDLTLFLIIFGVIGARLYYVLFKLEDFVVTDAGSTWNNVLATLKEMVNIREGGLAIYGGIIAGALTAVVFARVKKIRIPVVFDILAPSVMVGQIVGRWGNFMNVEAYGSETDLPWRMGVGFGGGAPYVHPTFLYESLWNLLGLILITVFYKKKKFHGQVFLFYAIWYGAGRAFIEGLRTDSLMLGSFRVSQLLSVVICLAGIVLMVIGMNRAPRVSYASAAADNADSVPVSPDEKADGEAETICDDAENVPEQSADSDGTDADGTANESAGETANENGDADTSEDK